MDPLARAGVRVAWRQVSTGSVRREVAYALIRELAGDADLVLTQTCAHCGGAHGPVLASSEAIRVSVAYARARVSGDEVAVVAVAASDAVSALGVDAEFEVDAVRDAAGVAEALGRSEADILDWVRVEAALKATGAGIRITPADVRVEVQGDSWRAAVPGAAGPFTGVDVTRIPTLVVAVAFT